MVIVWYLQGVLEAANQLGADYLYQKDKGYDTSYDTGDKAIQCGRHNDIFKLWLMWRSKVTVITEDLVHVADLHNSLDKRIKDLILLLPE